MNKRLLLLAVLVFSLALFLSSCAEMKSMTKPSAEDFKDPMITLESFQVPQYDEYWYYSGNVEPTKGKAGDRGAPLPMSFVFNIENPNPYPILLEEIKYTVVFDHEFVMITTNDQVSNWIPAGKTDQVRVTTLITVRSALTGLLLANAPTLKEKGWNPWDTLEKWWKGVPEMSVPVSVTEGAFLFSVNGMTKVLPYKVTIPAL
jgi:outer membrane lipoprotein-sorting protein